MAAHRRLAALKTQLDEKYRAPDRFGHQPHTMAFIEQEIADLETQIAAQRQALS